MTLRKTDVLPLDDVAKARDRFRHAVAEPLVVFVTLGQGAAVEALVSLGDDYAGDEQDARRGLWAPRLADVRAEIAKLREAKPGLRATILANGAQAFVLSVAHEIRDVIALAETADDARVVESYLRAETQ